MAQINFSDAVADPTLVANFDPTVDQLVFTGMSAADIHFLVLPWRTVFTGPTGSLVLPFYFDNGADLVFSDGSTLLLGDDWTTIPATSTADSLSGGAGNDHLRAYGFADTIDGGQGDNLIYGNQGNDQLRAGAGADSLYGGQGADIINDTGGDNLVYGNLDGDTIATGSGADTVYGGQGADVIVTGAGNDWIFGNRGGDALSGGAGADHFVFRRGNEGVDTITDFTVGEDKITLAHRVFRQAAIDGTNFVNNASGTAAAGAATRFIYAQDTNTLYYDPDGTGTAAAQAMVVFAGGADGLSAGDFRVVGVPRNVAGGDGADTLRGESGNDILAGGAGADLLSGGVGRDVLRGGAGADTLIGGRDNDAVYFDDLSSAVNANLLTGRAVDAQGAVDVLSGFEQIYGGAFNDTLAGDPRIFYTTYNGNVAYSGYLRIFGQGGDDLIRSANGWYLSGGPGADTLIGDGGPNRLSGDLGDDLLLGGGGAESLEGGPGSDTLSGGGGSDALSGADGYDLIAGGDGGDQLFGGAGRDTLSGGSGRDTLHGGAEADIMMGGQGSDELYGLAGQDTLLGGDGFDWLLAAANLPNVGLVVNGTGILANGQGNPDILVGGAGADTLIGESGADDLRGGGGADRIIGGYGYDRLVGGRGNDSMTGGPGNDCFDLTQIGADDVDRISDFSIGDWLRLAPGAYVGGTRQVGADVHVPLANGAVVVFENATQANVAGALADQNPVDGMGEEFLIGTQSIRSMDILPGDGLVVVYSAVASGYYHAFAQRYDATGNTIGAPIHVSKGSMMGRKPAVTAHDDGGFTVAYTSRVGGEYDNVCIQRFTADGTATGALSVTETFAAVNGLTLDETSDGRLLTSYVSWWAPPDDEIGYNGKVNVSGTGGFELTVIDSGGYPFPVAPLAGGGVVAGWRVASDLRFKVTDASGNQLAETTISSGADAGVGLHLAALNNGGFVAVWVQFVAGGNDEANTIMGRQFDAAGNPVGVPFQIQSGHGPLMSLKDVEALPGGGLYVVLATPDGEIVGQRIDAAGNRIGDEQALNIYSEVTDGYWYPGGAGGDVTLLSDGNLLASWFRETNTDSGVYGLYGREITPGQQALADLTPPGETDIWL